MIEQLISPTRIITLETLTANDLNQIIHYTAGPNANVCFVCDHQPLAVRDKLLEDLSRSRKFTIQNKVFPDPKTADIMEMAENVRDQKIEVIVGIGGGSTLDSAKAMSVVLCNGGDLDQYLGPEAEKKIEKKEIKLILIPTTAGTGSEVTKFGVYTSRSGRKHTLNHAYLQADAAVLAAHLTYGLPPAITAATAFDALSHALETLWNKNATETSDLLAIQAATEVLTWMEKSYQSAQSNAPAARQEMLVAACKAGIAFNLTGTAAVHALSFIFSEEWHMPHGIACAFTLVEVLKFNLRDKQVKQKLLQLACNLFGQNEEDQLIEQLISKIEELQKKFKLATHFKDFNIQINEKQISQLFNKALTDPKMKNNIMPVQENDIMTLLKHKL